VWSRAKLDVTMRSLDLERQRDALVLDQVLAAAVCHYERAYRGLRVDGPSKGENFRAFAAAYAAEHAPYLDDAFHRGMDAALDRVAPSATFVACWDGEVVGMLRLRIAALEFPHMSPALQWAAREVEGFAEYSRLMVGSDHRSIGIGRLLVAQATRWVIAETSAPGIVALCRPKTATVFRTYGLRPMARSVTVEKRDHGMYDLIAGSWASIRDELTRRPPREMRSRATEMT
jgi:GNAT superfamily N-acetyltransferase